MDFKNYLKELKEKGAIINIAIPGIGITKIKINNIVEDIVELEEEKGGNVYFLHYTNVIVVT
jgi:hypothetical protein